MTDAEMNQRGVLDTNLQKVGNRRRIVQIRGTVLDALTRFTRRSGVEKNTDYC